MSAKPGKLYDYYRIYYALETWLKLVPGSWAVIDRPQGNLDGLLVSDGTRWAFLSNSEYRKMGSMRKFALDAYLAYLTPISGVVKAVKGDETWKDGLDHTVKNTLGTDEEIHWSYVLIGGVVIAVGLIAGLPYNIIAVIVGGSVIAMQVKKLANIELT